MIQPHPLPNTRLQLSNNKKLSLSHVNIMGILNVTPDSFSDGGQHNQLDDALYQCEQMLKDGASIIDIGGESTRPHASPVTIAEEQNRVLPVVEAIKQRFDTIISIDTSKPAVIAEAHTLGADIWNDVRSLQLDGAVEMAVQLDIPVMLMHMRGEPDTMLSLTHYDNVVDDVMTEWQTMAQRAINAGVRTENIILDVGFGFAKNTAQNLALLQSLSKFHRLGFPLMIGLSRKRMLGDALEQAGLDNSVLNRLPAGLVANTLAVMQGVSIIRTHDVLQTAQGLALTTAIMNSTDCR